MCVENEGGWGGGHGIVRLFWRGICQTGIGVRNGTSEQFLTAKLRRGYRPTTAIMASQVHLA